MPPIRITELSGGTHTGHLRTPTGKRYGYQLTFFRHRVDSNGLALNPSKWFADNVTTWHTWRLRTKPLNASYMVKKLNRAALGAGRRRGAAPYRRVE